MVLLYEIYVVNVAGRRRADFCDPSHVRTRSQSCAEIESSRARGPYTAGYEIHPQTEMRTATLQSKRQRFLPAYGPAHPPQGRERTYRPASLCKIILLIIVDQRNPDTGQHDRNWYTTR